MKQVIKNKGMARQVAIDFQRWASERNMSYKDIAYYQNYFYNIAKKFGLVREFKENGII